MKANLVRYIVHLIRAIIVSDYSVTFIANLFFQKANYLQNGEQRFFFTHFSF